MFDVQPAIHLTLSDLREYLALEELIHTPFYNKGRKEVKKDQV
jgi:hypothetical protein